MGMTSNVCCTEFNLCVRLLQFIAEYYVVLGLFCVRGWEEQYELLTSRITGLLSLLFSLNLAFANFSFKQLSARRIEKRSFFGQVIRTGDTIIDPQAASGTLSATKLDIFRQSIVNFGQPSVPPSDSHIFLPRNCITCSKRHFNFLLVETIVLVTSAA